MSGKFLTRSGAKFLVRGVTYGTFAPDGDGETYPDPTTVARDFARMVEHGVNSVRTYTPPPRWLLDLAEGHGLMVMVGIAWEHHVAFLDYDGRAADIELRVREAVRAGAGHPAVLCYSIGNEIPASIVRWHGRHRIERFLRRLYDAAKDEDPEGLVTYVNFPSTEYLDLDFVDFLCFNVYLEEEERLRAYLGRLHNLAGGRPLVMAEMGLDSRRHGVEAQARSLRSQLATAFEIGCAGAFVFAWTDEWYITYLGEDGRGQGGTEILDWDFGLTDRDRRPKPALEAVSQTFAEAPLPPRAEWPRISVVVCSYNGEATIRYCCEGLAALDYPDFEVIVVDDGSTDATASIAEEYGFKVIRLGRNQGLSTARNVGWQAATGEIVAYTDDDAAPDPDWLKFLAAGFAEDGYVGVGGPNILPVDSSSTAWCVGNAPGNPNHVLVSDREAEHIPGCNSAFRRDALDAVGGFDPRFRAAGDDVDLCWRLQERGWRIGFHPGAMVWHQRRGSLWGFWHQQRGYGKAEALLEEKWPQRYNVIGHLSWGGRIYGNGLLRALYQRAHVYHGSWGSAPFQSLYERSTGTLAALPLTPEWYLVIGVLAGLSALGVLWSPLLAFVPLLAASVAALVGQAVRSALRAHRPPPARTTMRERCLVALLFLVQPLARLSGRLRHGLAPWRHRGRARLVAPYPRSISVWSDRWRSGDERLRLLEEGLRAEGGVVLRGGDSDRWDLEVRSGSLASARVLCAVEEHGAGRQLVRFRVRPHLFAAGLGAVAALALLSVTAAVDGGVAASAVLAAGVAVGIVRAAVDASDATGQVVAAICGWADREGEAMVPTRRRGP